VELSRGSGEHDRERELCLGLGLFVNVRPVLNPAPTASSIDNALCALPECPLDERSSFKAFSPSSASMETVSGSVDDLYSSALDAGFTDALVDKRRFFGDESDLCEYDETVEARLTPCVVSAFFRSSLLT
jgi:hypothetical protein